MPLRVLNASTTQIELAAGENLADFCPLIESCLFEPHVCGAVGNKTTPQIISDKMAVLNTFDYRVHYPIKTELNLVTFKQLCNKIKKRRNVLAMKCFLF